MFFYVWLWRQLHSTTSFMIMVIGDLNMTWLRNILHDWLATFLLSGNL